MSKHSNSARPAHPQCTSISVLIKNLRLLNLDEEFDWPQVTQESFSAQDSIQNQKRRVRIAEWVLFKLFYIWDEEDAKEKLKAYFPPLEPIQSSNLRAALFKHLNELKRNEILDKTVIIRRSTLEECKGRAFEELLAAFSTAVLQKTMIESPHDRSITQAIVIGTSPPLDNQSQAALSLAYKASLTKTLGQREEMTKRYQKFGQVLNMKEITLRQRTQILEQTNHQRSRKSTPKRTLEKLRTHLTANWHGKPEMVDSILQGDRNRKQDSLLERSFSDVWPLVESDTISSMSSGNNESLLQDLERRIGDQKNRLRKWESIKEGLVKREIDLPSKPSLSQEESHSSGNPNRRSEETGAWSSPDPASQMDNEAPVKPISLLHRNGRKSGATEFIEADGDHTDDYSQPTSILMKRQHRKRDSLGAIPLMSSANTSAAISNEQQTPSSVTDDSLSFIKLEYKGSAKREGVRNSINTQSNGSSARKSTTKSGVTPLESSVSHNKLENTTPEPEPAYEEIDESMSMATKILYSVYNRPSPSKPPPSLAERTRLSMALMSPQKQDRGKLPSHNRLSPTRTNTNFDVSLTEESVVERSDIRETLADRTRQSMSLMTATKPHGRRSTKTRALAVYPTNQFETPSKDRSTFGPEDSLLEDTLCNLDVDYDFVFKSRPKIALSPPLVPVSDAVPPLEERSDYQFWVEGSRDSL